MARACSNSLTLYDEVRRLARGNLLAQCFCRTLSCSKVLQMARVRSLRQSSGAECGVGLSASVAMFNHDCDPNATWALDADGCLVVHTVRPVRAAEEICISCASPHPTHSRRDSFVSRDRQARASFAGLQSRLGAHSPVALAPRSYVDPCTPVAQRRAKLLEAFFFECDCLSCAAGLGRWTCALCGRLNGPLTQRCSMARCLAPRHRFTAPLARSARRQQKETHPLTEPLTLVAGGGRVATGSS